MAKDTVVEIDLGEYGGDLAGFLQHSAARKDADRNQQEPSHEQSRQQQEEDDS